MSRPASLDGRFCALYTGPTMIIDLHNHTSPKSMCSYLDPRDLIRRAKELGLDGICLTEHDRIWPAEEAARLAEENDFLVLRGVEVTTDVGHVLVFGLEEMAPGIFYVKRLREVVNEAGGVMILAHPTRHGPMRITPEAFASLFEALEALNGGDVYFGTASTQNNISQFGLKGTGGSDAHALREIGRCATEFDCEIKNEKDLITALKGNGYHALRLR